MMKVQPNVNAAICIKRTKLLMIRKHQFCANFYLNKTNIPTTKKLTTHIVPDGILI